MLLIFSFFIAILLGLQAQTPPDAAIEKLKTGAVIINLTYPQKTIDALIKAGRKDEAMIMDQKAKIQQSELMEAFKNKYTFSQYYFVNAKDLGELTAGNPKVVFDSEGSALSAIPEFYLFAEIGGSPTRNIEGLLVRDSVRDPLVSPFPYFVKIWKFFHIKKKSIDEVVEEWNQLLYRYEARVKKYK